MTYFLSDAYVSMWGNVWIHRYQNHLEPELNSSPPQEHYMLLTPEPFL